MSDTVERPAELAVIASTSVSTIVAADKDDILGKLAAKVAAFKPDVSTESGRAEMRSLAYEIAKSKTALVKIGKGLTESWRKSTKAVNEECNTVEQRMDELRDKVRAPLTAWENREKARVAAHEANLSEIVQCGAWSLANWETLSVDQMRERLAELQANSARDWEEFADRASEAFAVSTDQINQAIVKRERADAEAAELARLRAEEIERQRVEAARLQAEREKRIAAEAAEQARLEAEARAEQERQEEAARVDRQRREEAEAAEAQRQAAAAEADRLRRENEATAERERQAIAAREAADERARQAEEQRRLDAEEAQRRVEQDRLDAEARRVRDAAEAERRRVDAEAAAVAAEQRRVAEQAEVDRLEQQRRADDRAHRTKFNNEALAALVEKAGLKDVQARAVIAAIAKREVPHVTISY